MEAAVVLLTADALKSRDFCRQMNHIHACPGCNACVPDWPKFNSIRGAKNRLMWRQRFAGKIGA